MAIVTLRNGYIILRRERLVGTYYLVTLISM